MDLDCQCNFKPNEESAFNTCGSGRIARISMMKYLNKYLFAITRGSSINSPLPNTREGGAIKAVRIERSCEVYKGHQ